MPRVIIDTSGVPEGQTFQVYDGPIPKTGLYKAVWKRGWWTKSKNGKPMLKVLFLLETDHKEKKVFNGYAVWHQITYEASTMWKMQELFAALWAGKKAAIDYDENANGEVTRIGKALPGKTYLLIHGETDFYNGKESLKPKTLAAIPRKDEELDDEIPEEDESATPFDQAQPKEATTETKDPWDSGAGWEELPKDSEDTEPPF